MAKGDYTGSTFLVDSFTEPSDVTDLSTHTPDTDLHSNGWTPQSGAGLEIVAADDELNKSTTDLEFMDYIGLSEANLYAEIKGKTGGTDSGDTFHIMVRNSTGDTGYDLVLKGTGQVILFRRDPGSTSLEDTHFISGFSESTIYTLRLEIDDAAIRVYVDDTLEYNSSDTTYRSMDYLRVLLTGAADTPRVTYLEAKYESQTVAQQVSNTLELQWNIFNEVSDTLDLRWNMRAKITQTLDAQWNILNKLSQTAQFLWNIIWQPVGQTLDLRWDMYAKLQRTSELQWNILNSLSQTLDLRWHIAIISVSKTIDLRWRIEALNAYMAVHPFDSGANVYYALIDKNGTVVQGLTDTGVTEINPKNVLSIPGGITVDSNLSEYGVVAAISGGFQGSIWWLGPINGIYDFYTDSINDFNNSLPAIKEVTDQLQFSSQGWIFSIPQAMGQSVQNDIDSIQSGVNALPTLSDIYTGQSIDGQTLHGILSVLLANAAGELERDPSTGVVTIKTPDGSEIRIVGTADAQGDRSSITLTPDS